MEAFYWLVFGVWFSLLASQIAFFFRSSLVSTFNSLPLALLSAFLCAETNFLIGVWSSLHRIRIVNGAIALFVLVICLQVRVVFHSFGRYIQLPPPFSYLLVTVTMLGGAAAAAAYALGMIADAASSVSFMAIAVIASTSGARSASASASLSLPLFLPSLSG